MAERETIGLSCRSPSNLFGGRWRVFQGYIEDSMVLYSVGVPLLLFLKILQK